MPAKGWKKADHMNDEKQEEAAMLTAREAQQRKAAAKGRPTYQHHDDVSGAVLDELEQRTMQSIFSAKDDREIKLEDFQEEIKAYLGFLFAKAHDAEKKAKRQKMYPSVTGLCCWMGISNHLFKKYADFPEYKVTLQHFEDICAQDTLDNVKNGKMNTIGGIWSGKVEHKLLEPTVDTNINVRHEVIDRRHIDKLLDQYRQPEAIEAECKEVN